MQARLVDGFTHIEVLVAVLLLADRMCANVGFMLAGDGANPSSR